MQNKNVQFVDLGLVPYKETWDLQESLMAHTAGIKLANRNLAEADVKSTPNFLLFCEHPHVYTLGKSGAQENLLLDHAHLDRIGAQFFKINRA